MGMSLWHLIVFLVIVVLLFGRTRIPALGRASKEFWRALKKGSRGEGDIDITPNDKEV